MRVCSHRQIRYSEFVSGALGLFWGHAAEWLLGVQLRHFSLTCAVHIEDCGDCWKSASQVSWLQFPAAAGLFTFLYFPLSSLIPT